MHDGNPQNIWFFHHYSTPPNMSGLTRPFNFGKQLKKYGIETAVFAASYLHYSDVNLIDDNRKYLLYNESDIPYIFINTPSSATGTLARIKNMLFFYFRLLNVTKEYAQRHGAPDVIIASSPHPLVMIAGIKAARQFNIPCICEVRDLWPEAIFSFGKLKETSFIGKILTAGEHWIYRKANALIFTKEGDIDYLKEQKWDTDHGGDISLNKCWYINNGVNLDVFLKEVLENKLNDTDLLDDTKFNVIYAGAIRPVNNIGNILDAAALLKGHTDIQFLIYGDGNQLETLKQRVKDEGLNNVKMMGYVEKKFIPYILSKSSVNILNYSQSKYNWTRGNSSNKLFEYMASGKPTISTIKMGYCILEKYKCGLTLEVSTPEELAKVILEMYDMPKKQYEEMSKNAMTGAADFDFQILTEKLLDVVKSVNGKAEQEMTGGNNY